MDEAVSEKYMVDGIITVVDAINGTRTLNESEEAQSQVGFADRLLLSKVDIANKEVVQDLTDRLHHINPRAPIIECNMGNIDINEVLDIHGFNLDAALELDPDFLKEEAPECCEHDHHDHEEGCCCGLTMIITTMMIIAPAVITTANSTKAAPAMTITIIMRTAQKLATMMKFQPSCSIQTNRLTRLVWTAI